MHIAYFRTDTVSSWGSKLWKLIPDKINHASILSAFKPRIKSETINNFPYRLCKIFVKDLGFVEVCLRSKSVDVFLYDRSHHHTRVKNLELLGRLSSGFLKENCWLYQWILARVFRFHEHNIGVFRTLSNIYESFFPKHSYHRVKSAHIQSYSAPYFPAVGVNTGKYGPK